MTKLSVKNGTPVGNEPLCRSCTHGQYTVGYRESDLMVICTNVHPNRVVPFVVCDCTAYEDRHRPDWEQMNSLALNLSESRRKPTPGFRQNGFSTVPVFPTDDEDEFEDEAARRRA